MPELGPLAALHPQVVHFVIALLVVGVLLRLVSLSGRVAFAGPAALTLLLLGTGAALVAMKSGTDAHGPVERVPGARDAVEDHEWWATWTRNVFLLVTLAELAALGLKRWQKEKLAHFASAGLGVIGLVCLLETGEHGGRVVYGHAGGVGIREGKPEDVGRLLLAGLYFEAQVDRKAGRPEDAAVLIELAAKRFGSDTEVQLLAAESQLLDRQDPAAALAALGRISVPPDKRRLRSRHAILTADALAASGQKDGARAALQQLLAEYPDDPRLRKKFEELGGR